jgi:lipoprotein-releasing system permease protein
LLPLRIAWRFLTSSPVQSGLIAAGISVGIATQIFVGSIIVSLQGSLLETTIGSAAHVTLQAIKESDPVRFTPEMRKILTSDPRIKPGTVTPVRSVPALYSNGNDSSSIGLLGGELKQLEGIYKLKDRTVEGRPSLQPGQIMLGKDFADKFGLKPGDSISLKFQNNETGSFVVTGIFDLAQQLPGVSVVEWQGQNKSLLAGLVSQAVSSYMIQGFVLVAVALGIASTLAIAAVQKTRQIGILKAMGLTDAAAGQVFLWQAAILGVTGSLGGVLASFALLALFSLAPTPFEIGMQPSFIVASSLIGVTVALLSSIIPTRRTARLDPIEVIQSG